MLATCSAKSVPEKLASNQARKTIPDRNKSISRLMRNTMSTKMRTIMKAKTKTKIKMKTEINTSGVLALVWPTKASFKN